MEKQLKDNNKIKTCDTCSFFIYGAPQMDQPYPEVRCSKGVFDGITSQEEEDYLSESNNCEQFKSK